MKLFVTGATGFIGTHLVKRLIAAGYDVTINLREGKKSPFSSVVKTHCLGIRDIKSDISFFKKNKFSGIIHLASLYITNHKPEDVTELISSNVKFSAYVLECAAKAEIQWFINTGTFWQHYNNEDYSPVNLYAASKQAFESIARFYIDTNQILFCTLKLSDTYGPNDTRVKIFNLWDKASRSGEALDMSPGEQIIDISHIDDVTNAYILLINHLAKNTVSVINGDNFAVQSNERMSLKDLSKLYMKSTEKKISINWGGRAYRDREVMVPWNQGKTVPGWKQQVSLLEGLKRTFGEK